MKIEVTRQDMVELRQLLEVYMTAYESVHAGALLEELSGHYKRAYGESIEGKGNPRRAGRKSRYTEKEREKIRELRGEGMTIREIAERSGISVGYVQGVLKGTMKHHVQ